VAQGGSIIKKVEHFSLLTAGSNNGAGKAFIAFFKDIN
jgi:hypothetical protein